MQRAQDGRLRCAQGHGGPTTLLHDGLADETHGRAKGNNIHIGIGQQMLAEIYVNGQRRLAHQHADLQIGCAGRHACQGGRHIELLGHGIHTGDAIAGLAQHRGHGGDGLRRIVKIIRVRADDTQTGGTFTVRSLARRARWVDQKNMGHTGPLPEAKNGPFTARGAR